MLDVGGVVVEAGDEERFRAARRRRARAATARTTGSRAARTTAGNAAPSTTRRSSRRGRTAAAGRRRGARCGCAPAGASGLRGGVRREASGAGGGVRRPSVRRPRADEWTPATGAPCAGRAAPACYDSAPWPCPPRKKTSFCQKRPRPARSTTPGAAAARASRPSSTQVRAEHPDYFCAPVPPFGDPAARLLIVGLAPGMHGANASGRPFTGDYAGILLYATLHAFGFASRADARRARRRSRARPAAASPTR